MVEVFKILKALYTVNKGAKQIRDSIRAIEHEEKWVPDELKDSILSRMEERKMELYDLKEIILFKILKNDSFKPFLVKDGYHIFSGISYYDDTEFIMRYLEFSINNINYGFHFDGEFYDINIIDSMREDGEILGEINDEISAKKELPHYKSISYAVKILEKFIDNSKREYKLNHFYDVYEKSYLC